MEITQNLYFSWMAYTETEYRWVEIILSKPVLQKEDYQNLLDEFNITPPDLDKSEDGSLDTIGALLLRLVRKERLLPRIAKLIEEKYPFYLSFDDVMEYYKKLVKLDPKLIRKIYLCLSQNKLMKDFISVDKNLYHFTKNRLVFLVIEELY